MALTLRSTSSAAFSNSSSFFSQSMDAVGVLGAVGSFSMMTGIGYIVYRIYPLLSVATIRVKVVNCILSAAIASSTILPRMAPDPSLERGSIQAQTHEQAMRSSTSFILCLALQVLALSMFVFAILCWLEDIAAKYMDRSKMEVSEQELQNVADPKSVSHKIWRILASFIDFTPKHILITTIIIFVCWMPVLIINGPAIIGVDAMVQLIQYKTGHVWDPMLMNELPGYRAQDHHPVFDTLLYGLFDQLGVFLGNEIAGMRVLIICQSLFAAFSLAVALAWIRRRTSLPDGAVVAILFFSALLPAFPMYMSIVLKDTTWLPFFVLWCVLFYECVYRVRKHERLTISLITAVVVFGIVGGLTKKTSVYVTGLSLLALALFAHKNRVRVALMALLPPILVAIVIPATLFSPLRIAPGGPQEAISVPMQQVAKVAIDKWPELSPKDKKAIEKVIDVKEAHQHWNRNSSDYVKHYAYRQDATKLDRTKFMAIWARLFFRYPGEYFKAALYLAIPFVVHDTYYYTSAVRCGWWEAGGRSLFPGYEECALSHGQKTIAVPLVSLLNKIPPFSLLGSEAVYVLWIPLVAMGFVVIRREYGKLLFTLPFVFTWLNLLALPAHQVRYSLGFLFCFALMIAVPFIREESRNTSIADDQVVSATLDE